MSWWGLSLAFPGCPGTAHAATMLSTRTVGRRAGTGSPRPPGGCTPRYGEAPSSRTRTRENPTRPHWAHGRADCEEEDERATEAPGSERRAAGARAPERRDCVRELRQCAQRGVARGTSPCAAQPAHGPRRARAVLLRRARRGVRRHDVPLCSSSSGSAGPQVERHQVDRHTNPPISARGRALRLADRLPSRLEALRNAHRPRISLAAFSNHRCCCSGDERLREAHTHY